jgi:hypothetical protein
MWARLSTKVAANPSPAVGELCAQFRISAQVGGAGGVQEVPGGHLAARVHSPASHAQSVVRREGSTPDDDRGELEVQRAGAEDRQIGAQDLSIERLGQPQHRLG